MTSMCLKIKAQNNSFKNKLKVVWDFFFSFERMEYLDLI